MAGPVAPAGLAATTTLPPAPAALDNFSIKGVTEKIAEIQAAAVAKASAAAKKFPHSSENWQSPGDIGLMGTLLVIAFVVGSVFLLCYVGSRQGWWVSNDKGKGKGKYEVLPTRSLHD